MGPIWSSSPMTWTGSAFRWSPGSPPIPTGTTCSGIPGSATCRATPPPPAPALPVKPGNGGRGWRRRARRDRGVLLAGDMLSDLLIPLLDPRRPGQVGAYEAALDRLGEAARHVDVLVPGHGAVAEGPEVAARLAADHAYIDALRRGEEPVDARLGPDWLPSTSRTWSRPDGPCNASRGA